MTDDRQPPPDVAEAARTVDQWLREQEALAKQPQRVESAAERFMRMPRQDAPRSDLPAWKDPRLELSGRWHNPRAR